MLESRMSGRRVLLYFAWSRPAETGAPLAVIDDRFPAVFELRRLFYPKFERWSDPGHFDQGIAGFLDQIQKPNFQGFTQQAEAHTGRQVIQIERITDDGAMTPLDRALLAGVDTIVVISFDSFRTDQAAAAAEVEAIRHFLDNPDNLIFVCPHHDIGEVAGSTGEDRVERQLAEYLHHGDHGIPPRQGFGGFARTLLAGLGVPVDNRFGLRPASAPDGTPAPVETDRALDELGLLRDVETFNLHPHLPQLERIGGMSKPSISIHTCRNSSASGHRAADGRSRAAENRSDGAASPVHAGWPIELRRAPAVAAGYIRGQAVGLRHDPVQLDCRRAWENLRRFWANITNRPARL